MAPNLLVLGGTAPASELCRQLAAEGLAGTVSLAGRVAKPAKQALPMRVGGFGGVKGLACYLRDHQISHVIDATHPFAAQISANAVAACTQTGVPLIALSRPPWRAEPGDNWTHVPDMAGAVAALQAHPPARVMLAIGRQSLPAFAVAPQHHYLLRLVDPPTKPPPLPNHHVVVDRGPFTLAADLSLMRDHRIGLVVTKNAGGTGASAKLGAARALCLPVLMIDRPAIPARDEVGSVGEVLRWLHHPGTERGV